MTKNETKPRRVPRCLGVVYFLCRAVPALSLFKHAQYGLCNLSSLAVSNQALSHASARIKFSLRLELRWTVPCRHVCYSAS